MCEGSSLLCGRYLHQNSLAFVSVNACSHSGKSSYGAIMNSRIVIGATVALALAAAAAASPAARQNGDLRTGKYEALLKSTIMGEPEPPQKDEQCLTAQDLQRLDLWLSKTQGDTCTVSDRKATAGKITFNITCKEDGAPVTTRAELTTARDSFAATLRTTRDAGGPVESVVTMTARRIGDCVEQ